MGSGLILLLSHQINYTKSQTTTRLVNTRSPLNLFAMINNKIEPRTLLSILWIFILFNMIFRDLHEFLNEGAIEEMMSLKIPESTMLLYGLILEIPIMMVLLSSILGNKANKWTNIIAASITMLGIISSLPAGDLDDIFFGTMNVGAFIGIIYTAWKLPIQYQPASLEENLNAVH